MNKGKQKIVVFTMICLAIATFISWVFWHQEFKYSLPTPVPSDFVDIKVGEKVDLKREISITDGNPVLLHFYNPDCPCSRFNIREFESLARRYQKDIHFLAVIQSNNEDAAERFKKKYDLDVPTILDKEGVISDKCGIYATPQAVLLDKNSNIYFKGNYNKARFCTAKETKFVEMAIEYLLQNKSLPLAIQSAMTEAYGCSLPSDEAGKEHTAWF